MLDRKLFEDENLSYLQQALIARNVEASLADQLQKLSSSRRELIQKVDELKAKRNAVSKEIGALKARAKQDPVAQQEADTKIKAMRDLGEEIKEEDKRLKEVDFKFDHLSLQLPNLAHESVPIGKDEESNQEVRKWGEPHSYDFEVRDHVELGEELGILDFNRSGKLAGARFALYRGAGAVLERALIQFMLDLHTTEHGYEEIIPPFLVNRETMTGTGQLPKFEEDLFKTVTENRELFLIPTAEVPLTNIYANEIIEPGVLPYYFTAYSPCFRSEAGSYGKDVRGLFRQHQFQKVELVKLVEPEHSFDELEKMTQNAERVLQALELPYRVLALSTGDMGFSAAKTYDLEVWLPGQDKFREISSCSNCTDFQARRAKIRYRKANGEKAEFVHTLNGSGVAVGRCWIAVIENNQMKDGRIRMPKALHPYLAGKKGFVKEGKELFLTKVV